MGIFFKFQQPTRARTSHGVSAEEQQLPVGQYYVEKLLAQRRKVTLHDRLFGTYVIACAACRDQKRNT